MGAAIVRAYAKEGAKVVITDIRGRRKKGVRRGRSWCVHGQCRRQRRKCQRKLFLRPHQILVNTIAPGPVETRLVAAAHDPAFRAKTLERIPVQRHGAPDDIASAAVFLAAEASDFLVGHSITVDGGTSISGMSA